MTNLLWLCFALSGAAALALEMLWMRSAGLVLGTTAFTAATVLACYFAGLGLGSVYARRSSSAPVRLYGLFELGAAAGALWSLGLFSALAFENAQALLGNATLAGACDCRRLGDFTDDILSWRNAANSRTSSRHRRHDRQPRQSSLCHQHCGRRARRRCRRFWPSGFRWRAGELHNRRRHQHDRWHGCDHDRRSARASTLN